MDVYTLKIKLNINGRDYEECTILRLGQGSEDYYGIIHKFDVTVLCHNCRVHKKVVEVVDEDDETSTTDKQGKLPFQ